MQRNNMIHLVNHFLLCYQHSSKITFRRIYFKIIFDGGEKSLGVKNNNDNLLSNIILYWYISRKFSFFFSRFFFFFFWNGLAKRWINYQIRVNLAKSLHWKNDSDKLKKVVINNFDLVKKINNNKQFCNNKKF